MSSDITTRIIERIEKSGKAGGGGGWRGDGFVSCLTYTAGNVTHYIDKDTATEEQTRAFAELVGVDISDLS